MKYYRVKPEYDNKHDYWTGYTTIGNELLTPKERYQKFPHLFDEYFEPCEVSRRQIYFCFGARFEA